MVVLKPAGVLSAGNIGGRLISVDGISKSLFYTHDGALLQAGESDGRILQGRTEQSRGKNGYFWQDWIWIPAGKFGATFVGLGMVNGWAWKDAVRKEVHLRRRVAHDDEGRGLLFPLCLMVG